MTDAFTLLRGRAIPVIRTRSAENARTLVQWLTEGGLNVVEITASVPDHLTVIRELASEAGLTVGAGTLTDAASADAALAAGARFLVTPWVVREVAASGQRAGVPVFLGAATPTEAFNAWKCGASGVKVFPISQLGGVAYQRVMQGILTDVPLMPTGGVTVDSAGDYLAAGAFAVGLGGQLGSDDDVARGDRRTVIDRARSLSQLAQPAA